MGRQTILCAITAAIAFAAGAPAPAQNPRNLALLIGIDDYINVRDLHGAVNDVDRVKTVLTGRFGFEPGNVTVLRNAQATRAAMLAAFETLIKQAQANDVVYVHYSGHGSRRLDDSNDEEDGWDETIVPHDSREPGIFDITDDEMNGIMTRLAAKTRNVTLILDSCYSGSATRGGADVRRVPDDERQPPAAASAAARTAEGKTDFGAKDPEYVLITGSAPNELSNEFDVNGVRQGALTHFLTSALLNASPRTTYKSIMETVAAQVTGEFSSQHPQIEGQENRVLFGLERVVTIPYLLAHPQATSAVVDGGTVYGLAPGSELDVYAPGTTEFATAKPTARLRLTTQMDGQRSEAEILSGGPIVQASRAVIRTRAYPDAKLRIYIVPPETQLTAEIRKALSGFSGFEMVTDEAAADMRIKHEGKFVFTQSADLVQMSPPIPVDAPGTPPAQRVVDRASDWMRWFAILRLQNADNALPAAIKIGDGTRARLTSGEQFDITVTNLSSEQAFMTLLNLEADGTVRPLSAAADVNPIPPFGARTRRIRFTTPADRTFVADVLKAILSTTRLDPAHFAQGAARTADKPIQVNDPLNRLIAATAIGQARTGAVVESTSWGTATARVEIWQTAGVRPTNPQGLIQTPRLETFIAHFPEGSRATPASVTSRGLQACPPGAGQPDECWDIEPMGPSSSSIELRPAGRRAESRAPLSLGAAWDQAERLRQQTGAEVVEPVFEVSLDDQAVDTTRSGGGTPDKPGARQNTEWSVTHVDGFRARARLRAALNLPENAEASGIIVAHPDTGYRQHAEFWNTDPAKSAVMADSGWNFVEDNARPLDPLQDTGALANPGHGTKSGSVIVSPPGKQWTGGQPNEYVTGVAPGARLVPLRVHTSVVHFNPSRLAKAINYAAEPDGVKIRLPPGEIISVISISMGGLPSIGLYKAVSNAKKHGVILIAAAGNQVKTVVWPARFDDAVAVAATNVECGTWPGSSNGGAVDISAPGESVWHAGVSATGGESAGMGQGTTYATATTAGVAALWVARHRGTPLFDRLKQEGRLTDAFRLAIQKTSWRPDGTGPTAPPNGVTCTQKSWNPGAFGPGIVNADRLLAEPLAEPPAQRDVGPEPAFPLFESLFQADVTAGTADQRFQALFPGTPVAALKALDAELVTLYALDEEVRPAIDALTGAGNPTADAYRNARAVLVRRDVSTAMAAAARRTP
jgi:thermitase